MWMGLAREIKVISARFFIPSCCWLDNTFAYGKLLIFRCSCPLGVNCARWLMNMENGQHLTAAFWGSAC